jgi:hypothetical protein
MNFIAKFFNRIRLWCLKRQFIKCLEEEALDFLLEALLGLMRIYCLVNGAFHRNIENFEARYSFRSTDGRIDAGVIFSHGEMEVSRSTISGTNVEVVFKDGKALKEFLFSDSPDIIGSILNGDVTYAGNLNYLSKFVYMARNLKRQFLPV